VEQHVALAFQFSRPAIHTGDVAGPREEQIGKMHLLPAFSLGNTYLGSNRESLVVAVVELGSCPSRSNLLNT
jgi:hypothetical protein